MTLGSAPAGNDEVAARNEFGEEMTFTVAGPVVCGPKSPALFSELKISAPTSVTAGRRRPTVEPA